MLTQDACQTYCHYPTQLYTHCVAGLQQSLQVAGRLRAAGESLLDPVAAMQVQARRAKIRSEQVILVPMSYYVAWLLLSFETVNLLTGLYVDGTPRIRRFAGTASC